MPYARPVKSKEMNQYGCGSLEASRDTIRKYEWMKYEVAPDWQGFCEFTYEDIGGVWEELGVIRKREVCSLFLSGDLRPHMDRISEKLEEHIMYGNAGLPVYFSPYLPPGTVISMSNPFPSFQMNEVKYHEHT